MGSIPIALLPVVVALSEQTRTLPRYGTDGKLLSRTTYSKYFNLRS